MKRTLLGCTADTRAPPQAGHLRHHIGANRDRPTVAGHSASQLGAETWRNKPSKNGREGKHQPFSSIQIQKLKKDLKNPQIKSKQAFFI